MIEKTIFTGANATDNALELENWLNDNASDYMENILNTDNVITADIISGGSIIFSPYNTQSSAVNKIILKNAAEQSINRTGGAQFRTAYKTSKGIILMLNNGGIYAFVKSNNNTIGIITSTANTGKAYYADFSESTAVTELSSPVNYQSELTSFANIALGDSGNYAIGMYGVYAYQYNTTGIITYNGIRYVYNKFFALAE